MLDILFIGVTGWIPSLYPPVQGRLCATKTKGFRYLSHL